MVTRDEPLVLIYSFVPLCAAFPLMGIPWPFLPSKCLFVLSWPLQMSPPHYSLPSCR